jgi:hypothetical protein
MGNGTWTASYNPVMGMNHGFFRLYLTALCVQHPASQRHQVRAQEGMSQREDTVTFLGGTFTLIPLTQSPWEPIADYYFM